MDGRHPGLGKPAGTKAWGAGMAVIAVDSLNAARIVIEEKKLAGARIGIEDGFGQRIGMSLEQFGQLQAMLPKDGRRRPTRRRPARRSLPRPPGVRTQSG